MRRFQDIALTVVAIAVGFSVIAYYTAGSMEPAVIEMPEVSNLENRYYAEEPELTREAFLDKSYQDGMDAFLADHVPLRDQVVLFNAGLQRASIATSAAIRGYDVYPTFFGSRYYAVPGDGLIVDRAEELPSEGSMRALDAWIATLNNAARQHPDIRFVYDCVARHDQTEANPTYRYYSNRLNPAWIQEHLIDRLDPHIDAFVDPVASYDEIVDEWLATDPHWTLKRALKSYNQVAERLGLHVYPYDNPVEVVDSWQGTYANSSLDLDYAINLEDLPIDFSQLSFNNLQEDGGGEKHMGERDAVLFEGKRLEADGASKYYEYFGGGAAEVTNSGENNGRTVLFVGDSLSYCLERFIASNYSKSVILLPGNGRYVRDLESYIEEYDPDDVIVMLHASKHVMFAEYSPAFIGL